MTPNEKSHYESLQKQDTSHRKLIRQLQEKNNNYKGIISRCVYAFENIKNWDEDLEEVWGDQGNRAKSILTLIKEKY